MLTAAQDAVPPALIARMSAALPRSGDVVFRLGRSLRSEAVVATEARPEFSHVGIVVIEEGTAFVVHALPATDEDPEGGTRKELLANFLSAGQAGSAALYRLRDTVKDSYGMAAGAAEAARSMAARHLPFDSDFDLLTPDRLYCTELVLRAYAAAGVDLRVSPSHAARPLINHPIVYPSDVQDSPLLKRLY